MGLTGAIHAMRADVEVAYAKPLSLVPSEKGRWVLNQLSENFANETVSQV